MTFGSAHSVVLLIDGSGRLTGATGVDVGGTLFNVEFLDGTCVSVFSGCENPGDFAFTDLSNAQVASNALLNQVFLDVSLGAFDSRPELTQGCGNTTSCGVFSPISLSDATTAQFAGLLNRSLAFENAGILDLVISVAQPASTTLDFTQNINTLARWTPAAQSVPEPASIALLALGLAGIGFSRRKKA